MKVIFLDIDGVLNKALVPSGSEEADILKVLPHGWMNKSLIKNFNELIKETGAKVVVSSAWRHDSTEENQNMLNAFGIECEVIGQTQHLGRYHVRGNEIKAWLEDNESLLDCGTYWNFKQYIIIDDSSDMLFSQSEHFIHTDSYAGLSVSAAYKAARKLNSLVNIPHKQNDAA